MLLLKFDMTLKFFSFQKLLAEHEVTLRDGEEYLETNFKASLCVFLCSTCSSWSLPAEPFSRLWLYAPDQYVIHEVNAAFTKSSKRLFEMFLQASGVAQW
jgi:hypothetical protein